MNMAGSTPNRNWREGEKPSLYRRDAEKSGITKDRSRPNSGLYSQVSRTTV